MILPWLFLMTLVPKQTIYVSPDATSSAQVLFDAQAKARDLLKSGVKPVIVLKPGEYRLTFPLILTPLDSGIEFRSQMPRTATIKGSMELKLKWMPHKSGIFVARVPQARVFDQLYVNGCQMHLARYPNYDESVRIMHGYAKDALSPERVKAWSNPSGAFIHAMHAAMWGGYHYQVTGKDSTGNLEYIGGWQNNRQMGMHPEYRFIEGVFEELDAEGEWFFDQESRQLYLYPPRGVNLGEAKIETVVARALIDVRGTSKEPAKNIRFSGIRFEHANRTFMDNREPLLRSDWTIYRGGAFYLKAAENCEIEGCDFENLGGNAFFIDGKNKLIKIKDCLIREVGGNGVAFVGEPKAVRNPLFEYGQRQSFAAIDKTPGPRSDDYPMSCSVEDCLITRTGRVELQSAPVQIAMSRRINVKNCSIYDVPRAGINIGDGCWGGHVIEGCDVFNTVKETGDHGSFNSWGRDRYWELTDIDPNMMPEGLPFLDAIEPTIIRNNRWRCDHGWDIDLDDGSSNYIIENNLCLNGGIKNREGFGRRVLNNIMVSNSFHPHVWYVGSGDVFERNIVFEPYKPIQVPKPWGKSIDYNLLHTPGQNPVLSEALSQLSGLDEHSIAGDALFENPSQGDYRVKKQSPTIKLGFRNFPMGRCGVKSKRLRALARVPEMPSSALSKVQTEGETPDSVVEFLGAKIKNLNGLGEMSATGMGAEIGVLVVEVPKGSKADALGLKTLDVILEIDGVQIVSVSGFTRAMQRGVHVLQVFRKQQKVVVRVEL